KRKLEADVRLGLQTGWVLQRDLAADELEFAERRVEIRKIDRAVERRGSCGDHSGQRNGHGSAATDLKRAVEIGGCEPRAVQLQLAVGNPNAAVDPRIVEWSSDGEFG